MPTEHVGQTEGLSLFVEELIGASFTPSRQRPTLFRDALNLTPEFDFFDEQRCTRRSVLSAVVGIWPCRLLGEFDRGL